MASYAGRTGAFAVALFAAGLAFARATRAAAAGRGASNVDARRRAAPRAGGQTGGASPFTDYTTERPGSAVRITAADLPPPGVTRDVDNPPHIVKRPKETWPQAPAGFQVQLYADGLAEPRLLRIAPNGDVFVVESKAGVMRVFRGLLATGKAAWSGVFAKGFH